MLLWRWFLLAACRNCWSLSWLDVAARRNQVVLFQLQSSVNNVTFKVWKHIAYISVECVTIKVPTIKELHALTSTLCPWISVGQGSIKRKSNDTSSQESHNSSPSNGRSIPDSERTSHSIRCKIVDLAHRDNGKVQGWEVMMEEELTLHEIEWEVVEGPAQH